MALPASVPFPPQPIPSWDFVILLHDTAGWLHTCRPSFRLSSSCCCLSSLCCSIVTFAAENLWLKSILWTFLDDRGTNRPHSFSITNTGSDKPNKYARYERILTHGINNKGKVITKGIFSLSKRLCVILLQYSDDASCLSVCHVVCVFTCLHC